MNSLIMFLRGKKSYIVSAIAVVYAISALLTHNIDVTTFVQLLVTALGLSTVKASVGNMEKVVSAKLFVLGAKGGCQSGTCPEKTEKKG